MNTASAPKATQSANEALNRMLVVPLSSQIGRVYPGEALIQLNGETRKAMTDQLTTAGNQRFRSRLGHISLEDMARIEAIIL